MCLLCYLLALLLAWLTPTPRGLLERMASPKFIVRQAAAKELESRLTYGLAVKLTVVPPANADARYHARRVVDAYWRSVEPVGAWPYIDALNPTSLCNSPNAPVVTRYLALARGAGLAHSGVYGDYRAAAVLWVEDLRRLFVPPRVIRAVLAEMAWRSDLYDALSMPVGYKVADTAKYRRMPGSPATWRMVSVPQADGTLRQELRPVETAEPPK